MIVFEILLGIIIAFVGILILMMLYIWWNARPIVKRLATSPDRQSCEIHGPYLHLCSKCHIKL